MMRAMLSERSNGEDRVGVHRIVSEVVHNPLRRSQCAVPDSAQPL